LSCSILVKIRDDHGIVFGKDTHLCLLSGICNPY